MANFFEGVWNALKHPIDEAEWMWDTTKGVLSGDMSLKDVPGSHQEMMNDITVPLLGDNKIAKNSDTIAGAVVGAALAAPALAGAAGGSGAGATGATAGTSSGFSLGSIGDYFTPGKAGDKWSALLPEKEWKYKGNYSDDDLGALADLENEAGGAVEAGLGKGDEALAKATGKMDFAKMAKVLESVNSNLDKDRVPQAQHRGTSFRAPDKSLYSNPLADREFKEMYSQPIYKKPGRGR